MKRIVLILFLLPSLAVFAGGKKQKVQQPVSDREYWCNVAYKMAAPVLKNMAEGKLQENMQLELSPTWDGRNKKVAYMECFGRLMAGISPWLALPDDDTPEGLKRKQLREWALKAFANAVDPQSPDYLGWQSGGQTLVDAAYIVQGLYRAYDALWKPLDETTKQRYFKELAGLHRYDPPYTNWILFVAMEECFRMYAGDNNYDTYRIHMAMNNVEDWYVGDGWYSDGPAFAFDYYNAYTIQPMYVECLEMIRQRKPNDTWICRNAGSRNGVGKRYEDAVARMQRYGMILERFISPEGTYPVFGRSIPYRMAVFQPLAQLAWRKQLPKELTDGQVRSALTAVMKRMFGEDPDKGSVAGKNFTDDGYLTIGFVGAHPNVADWYTNNGSLYITSEVFMPLGLPADDPFWASPAEDWTSKKAWEGKDFPKDHRAKEVKQRLYWE